MNDHFSDNQSAPDLCGFPLEHLDKSNRWVRLADGLPWGRITEQYNNDDADGAPGHAADARRIIGACIVKQKLSLSSEETALLIRENPYMQYLCGYSNFTTDAVISPADIDAAFGLVEGRAYADLIAETEGGAGAETDASDADEPTEEKPVGELVQEGRLTYEDVLRRMSPRKRQLAVKRFEQVCYERLTVRAINFLKQKGITLEKFVPFLGKEERRFQDLCPGQIMKKTIADVFRMAQIFAPYFLECAELSPETVETELLHRQFPLLTDVQLQHVLAFEKREGRLPLFYVLLCHARNSTNRDDEVLTLYYGIGDGGRHTIAELAALYAVSIQRIQQIVGNNTFSFTPDVAGHADAAAYESLQTPVVISAHSQEYLQIKEAEGLDCDFPAFAGLLAQLASFRMETVNGRCIAVNKDFRLRDAVRLRSIEATVTARHTEEQHVPLKDFANDAAWDERLCTLLRAVFEEFFDIKSDADECAVIPQNSVDVGREMYLLLEQNGRPMHLNELFAQFKAKYPDHKYTAPAQLTPYIFANKRIKSVGKSRTYGLDTWTDVVYASIRDILFKLVDESREPVSLTELETRVRQYFPKTNASSLLSNMLLDEKKRFVRFDDNTIGLRNRHYAEEKKEYVHRPSFEERIAGYRKFVETERHVPLSQGNDEEGSLFRWRYNVDHGTVRLTEEQRGVFNALMEEVRATGVPHSSVEFTVFKKCGQCREYIETNHHFPPSTDELYKWLKKMRKDFHTFTDNRRTYLTSLFAYLDTVGYY